MPYTPGVTNIIGPFILATVFDCILLGVVLVQSHHYFLSFPNDSRYFTIAIAALFLLCTYHCGANIWALYEQVVTHFGDLAYLGQAPIGFVSNAISTGLTAMIVQCFYAYRIFVLSGRKWYFPVLIVFLGLVSLGFSITCTVRALHLVYFAKFKEITYAIMMWLTVAAGNDVLITGVLVYYLQTARTKTQFERTKGFLGLVIQNTVENNMLTAVIALVDALSFGLSDTAWHVLPNGILNKFYAISILSSLNSRHRFAQAFSSPPPSTKLVTGEINHGVFMPNLSVNSQTGTRGLSLFPSRSEAPGLGAMAVQVQLETQRSEYLAEDAFPVKAGAHRSSVAY